MVTSGRILDLLADAVSRYRREGQRGVDWTLMHMSAEERTAFDLFLVRMKDPLAWQPGTTEFRFRARVVAMAEGRPASDVVAEAEVIEPDFAASRLRGRAVICDETDSR
jgi:hypothetical protein